MFMSKQSLYLNVCVIKNMNIFLYYTALRRELQKDPETVMVPKSSPKRFAVVSPKPQSPGESHIRAYMQKGAVCTHLMVCL